MIQKITFFLALLLLFPAAAGAHSSAPDSYSDVRTSPMMMHYIEDQALGDELHEEMEDLMVKMMSGTLTEEEAERLTELMQEYPAPHAMMMNRFGMMDDAYGASGWMGHHGSFGHAGSSAWAVLVLLPWLVWVIVGVLAAVWLWKQISGDSRKKKTE